MNRREVHALLLAPVIAGPALAQTPARLQGYTENLPPLNFQGPAVPSGFSVDLLQLMAGLAGLDLSVEVLPWPRALVTAASTPDSILFSLTRLPERESHYRWVGPIMPRRIVVYRLTRRPELRLRELRKPGRLRIGVVRDSAAALQLAEYGLTERQLELSQDDASNLRKLLVDRMDAILLLDWAAPWHLRELGLPEDTLSPMLEFDASNAYWYGLHPGSDPALATRLQAALDTLRADGRYEALRKRYFR